MTKRQAVIQSILWRRAGEAGFTQVTWDEALDLVADRIRATTPDRLAVYLTARGITNETYYVAQKFTRFLGSNNIDNAARVCHAPSTTTLKQAIGDGGPHVPPPSAAGPRT